MKDFITTIASLLILMMFLLQFTANQTTYTRIMGAEHSIKEFRLLSEEKGSINGEDILRLKDNISSILCCSPSEISVKVAEDSGEYIVDMPVYGIIGPAEMIGLSPEENVKMHTSRGVIAFREHQEEEPEEGQTEEEL